MKLLAWEILLAISLCDLVIEARRCRILRVLFLRYFCFCDGLPLAYSILLRCCCSSLVCCILCRRLLCLLLSRLSVWFWWIIPALTLSLYLCLLMKFATCLLALLMFLALHIFILFGCRNCCDVLSVPPIVGREWYCLRGRIVWWLMWVLKYCYNYNLILGHDAVFIADHFASNIPWIVV